MNRVKTRRLPHLMELWGKKSHARTKDNGFIIPSLFSASSMYCNHSRGNSAGLVGDSGSGGSIPLSTTGNSDETNSVDEQSIMMAAMNNNNSLDNGISEIGDVPDHVANQKRHVSKPFNLTRKLFIISSSI